MVLLIKIIFSIKKILKFKAINIKKIKFQNNNY